jgi:hypothetical protein
MIHFYTSCEHLFRTVTMYPPDERDAVLDRVVETEGWYGGRFAAGHREAYMRTRESVERTMYDDFAAKYCRPASRHPVFFYLRPDLDLDAVDGELRQRRALGETRTRYLLVDLVEIADTSQISFTVFDSHRSYAERCRAAAGGRTRAMPVVRDQGTVFRIDEVAEVFARTGEVPGLSFEVQIWDPAVLCLPRLNELRALEA